MVIVAEDGQGAALELLNEQLRALLEQGATAELKGKGARALGRPRRIEDARVICTSGRLLWRYCTPLEQPALRVPLYGLRLQSWTLEPAGAIVVYAQNGERLRLAPAARGQPRRRRYPTCRSLADSASIPTATFERALG